MSYKDEMIDAFTDWMPDNYYDLPKHIQLDLYLKFEQDFLEGQFAWAEAREDR